MKDSMLRRLAFEKRELLDTLALESVRELVHKRIMVIDDCEDTLKYIRRQLADIPDVDVCTFSDEIAAIKDFLTEKPDAVIMDINLESMKGTELGLIFKNLSLFNIPIIYISADKSIADVAEKYPGGRFHFLPKPLNKNEIIESLNMVMDGRGDFVS